MVSAADSCLTDRHLFAVWCSQSLETCVVGNEISVHDQNTIVRLNKVLRLRPHEQVQLFNDAVVLGVVIIKTSPREVACRVTSVVPNTSQRPLIDLVCGMVEQSAWTDVVRDATVIGVRAITPLETTKCRRDAGLSYASDRWLRVARAAAEQSKQYKIPVFKSSTGIDSIRELPGLKVWFDGEGMPLAQIVPWLVGMEQITCIVGPAGDFTADEKECLRTSGCTAVRLTPSVLRTEDAVMVGLGAIRSLITSKRC